jgi:hypothetical protein
MTSITCEIVEHILETLRESDQFASVAATHAGSGQVPRASVSCEAVESFPSDDSASARWSRLTATVRIHTRSDAPAGALKRALELFEGSARALLADTSRGGLCQDLPVGNATEVGRFEVIKSQQPEVELGFSVRCHFEWPQQEQP